MRLQPLQTVRAHIHDKGFNRLYTKWIYHGEDEEVFTNTFNDLPEQANEMHAILNDVAGQVKDHDEEEALRTNEYPNE